MKVLLVLTVLLGLPVFAHDDHGPKVNDGGKYGGVVAAAVIEGAAKKEVIYKAELVRSEDRTVRLYLFDKHMKLVDYSKFGKSISANVEVMKGGKAINSPFTLTLEGNHFKGIAPKPSKHPFNIDVMLSDGTNKLLIGFTNLD